MKNLLYIISCALALTIWSCERDSSEKKEELDLFKNYQEFNNHTYAITKDLYSWTDAKNLAVSKGGNLVIIDSESENDFIKTTYRQPLNTEGDILWIGLSDDQSEGNFKWVNDTTPNFLNWEEGEPNNHDNIQHYVHMYSNGKWDDVENISCYAVIEFDK